MPGRAERTRLAHQPQRECRGNEVADHRDQPDDAVDAIADIVPGRTKRCPALFATASSRASRCSRLRLPNGWRWNGRNQNRKHVTARAKRFRGYFAPLLVDDRPRAFLAPAVFPERPTPGE